MKSEYIAKLKEVLMQKAHTKSVVIGTDSFVEEQSSSLFKHLMVGLKEDVN